MRMAEVVSAITDMYGIESYSGPLIFDVMSLIGIHTMLYMCMHLVARNKPHKRAPPISNTLAAHNLALSTTMYWNWCAWDAWSFKGN